MTDAIVTILLILGCVVALAIGWVLTLFSMPGNWLIVGAAALYAWLTPDGTRWDLSWMLVGVLVLLASLGEAVELIASAAGVRRYGGSRRGAVLSIVFSIIGAVVGTLMIPVPIVGTLLGACVGAMAGAMAGESWKGTDPDATTRIGWAAFWGRLFGSFAKIMIACVLVAVTIAGIALH
jgi:uncharacterized protein YqgC (DUF456 family)